MRRARLVVVLVLLAAAVASYYFYFRPQKSLVLTGIVTTNDVVVSPQVDGRLAELKVAEGDVVTKDQVVALIDPREMQADSAYYSSAERGVGSQVAEAQAALRYQEKQTIDQIAQATSTLASVQAQQAESVAVLENARLELDRTKKLSEQGVTSAQQLDQDRTSYDAAKAHADSLTSQVAAARSALALAQSNAQQVAMKESQLQNTQHLAQAATAQREKADLRLAYTEVHAPIAGIVDVRAVRQGEFIKTGQPLLTLVNQDDLWVRVDVEETYIDRVRVGEQMQIRLPSGDVRDGVEFFRGVDAAFATERDVSRTKRDIRTFEVRLRTDNKDRRLALGMTAYVTLPLDR